MTPSTTNTPPLGIVGRVKAAVKTGAGILSTGRTPNVNPLSVPPKELSRERLVMELTNWVKEERTFWKPIFDRIKHEQRFAAGKQWPKEYKVQSDNLEPYVGDVEQQMLNRKTAVLYAKNPTPLATRREMMEFTKWDGSEASIMGAMQKVQTAQQLLQQHAQLAAQGVNPPPMPADARAEVAQAQEIIDDYNKGMARKSLMDKIAQTATLLVKREWETQSPDLVVSAKQMVTRILTSRVGYIKVMYRREMESPNTIEASINGIAADLEALQHAIARMKEPDFDPKSAEAEKFKLLMQSTADALNPGITTPRLEGVVIDFLDATAVIVDRNCKCLREFVGAKRIAHEILMDVEDCEAKYKISLRDAGAVLYAEDGSSESRSTDTTHKTSEDNTEAKDRRKVCVWEIQDKHTGDKYVICDGVKDFIAEPEPNEPEVSRFWSIIPVVFNVQNVEHNDPDQDITIYPRSDVRLSMPMQIDINTAGEGKREHRTANRPCWIGVRAKFSGNAGENDLLKLSSPRPAHTVLMLDSLNPSEKIDDFLGPLPQQKITAEMYDPSASMEAMMLATGQQASDIGQQAPDEKATGQNIAAAQKATTDSSNIDDLDYAFSCAAQMTWELCLREMPADVVKQKIGQGAVFPDVPAERIHTMNEIFLSIEAGSSGRPDQANEVRTFGVVGPLIKDYMLALGMDLEPLLKEALRIYNSKLDLDEFLKPAKGPQQAATGDKGQPQGAKESISIKLSDLSTEERAQALAKAGIKAGGQIPQAHPAPSPGVPAGKAAGPSASGPSAASRLDANNPEHVKMAQHFIRQAGGDRNKAREMAKSQGYQ